MVFSAYVIMFAAEIEAEASYRGGPDKERRKRGVGGMLFGEGCRRFVNVGESVVRHRDFVDDIEVVSGL